jgi:hypothetical protein
MSRKNILPKFKNITAGDMSANVTSAVTNIQYVDNVGIELSWTGTPTGTFTVEVSVSYEQDSQGNVINAGSWNALTLNPTPTASGSAGSFYISLNQIEAPWVRVRYIRTSGTGVLTSYICTKEI